MTALVRTSEGTFAVDLEEEELIGEAEDFDVPSLEVGLPRVVAAAAAGATIVVVVDRRPPLALSNDAGRTWREAGGGLRLKEESGSEIMAEERSGVKLEI